MFESVNNVSEDEGVESVVDLLVEVEESRGRRWEGMGGRESRRERRRLLESRRERRILLKESEQWL